MSEAAVCRVGRGARRQILTHEQLIDLLREEHPLYKGRGAAAVVRMRGWILNAFARVGVRQQRSSMCLKSTRSSVSVAGSGCVWRPSQRGRPLFVIARDTPGRCGEIPSYSCRLQAQ